MRKNIWLKIAAVALALSLWMWVIARGNTDVSVEASLEFENIPKGLWVVRSETVPFVSLGLRGHERVVKNLSDTPPAVLVDLEGLAEGTYRLDIRKGDVRVPAFVRVVNVYPPTVTVTLAKAATKRVPVRPDLVGKPKEGYRVVGMMVVPESVKVKGPEREVTKLESLGTEPVDIAGADGTLRREAGIAVGGDLEPEPATVTVEIEIERERR
ncbi:MAG: CdaR family protein [Nitrospirota bacterium]|jgi:YbbR domain-containing protein